MEKNSNMVNGDKSQPTNDQRRTTDDDHPRHRAANENSTMM